MNRQALDLGLKLSEGLGDLNPLAVNPCLSMSD